MKPSVKGRLHVVFRDVQDARGVRTVGIALCVTHRPACSISQPRGAYCISAGLHRRDDSRYFAIRLPRRKCATVDPWQDGRSRRELPERLQH